MVGDAHRRGRTIKKGKYLNEYPDYATAHHDIGRFIEDVYETKDIYATLGYQSPDVYESRSITP